MSDFAVSTKYTATDKMSGPFNKMKNNASAFGSVLKGILVSKVIIGGIQKLSQGMQTVSRDFIEFDAALTGAGAKFKDMSDNAEIAEKQMKNLESAARNVGATTEFSATEAAKGLEFLAMAGFGVEQSMAALPGVVDLATAANTDLATATDIASDSLGAFNLMTEDTVKLQENLARVNNVMAKTTTTANTDLVTLFEAVKKGAPAFTAAGQSIETFSALAGTMANAGVKGSEAGTSLRNVMLRLAKPTAEAQGVLKKLGIQTQDSQGNFKDVVDILADFEKGLVGMGDAQKTAALATVFGARSVTGINILLAEGTDKLRDYRQELINSDNAALNMATTIRTSLGNRLKVLQSSLTETGFKFINTFGDKLGQGLDKIIETSGALNKFLDANKDIINLRVEQTLTKIKEGFTLIKNIATTTFNIIKGGIDIVIRFKEVFAILTGAIVAYKIAVLAVNIAQAAQIGLMALGPILGFIKVMAGLARTEGILATAQLALNIAMNANPIGLVIAGVALLAGLAVIIVKNWDKVGPVFKTVGKVIMTALLFPINLVLSAITGLLTLISKIPGVGNALKPALDMLGQVKSGLGVVTFNGTDSAQTPVQAPNQEAILAERAFASEARFKGTLNINGAPEGSSLESQEEAPGFNVKVLGASGAVVGL